jgi:hypothetical protein
VKGTNYEAAQVQFSLASCHFILIRSKYVHEHPVIKQTGASLVVRDEFSHLYKTKVKS